jgi:predicted pyridoxine 5'-phosphate oxidase superfamily flavin-nucleotide-binding protein
MYDRLMSSYNSGSRELQDRFDTRRIADRLEQVTYKNALGESDAAMIRAADMFFLATADANGFPDCSYKGGDPGFVRVLSPTELAWPDYDGNGQFRSLGNVQVKSELALLFIDWERPARLRVHGRARLVFDDSLLEEMPGAMLVVRVEIERVFPNCPRYVHRMQKLAASAYVPRRGEAPPRPGWKDDPRFADALPAKDRAPGGG